MSRYARSSDHLSQGSATEEDDIIQLPRAGSQAQMRRVPSNRAVSTNLSRSGSVRGHPRDLNNDGLQRQSSFASNRSRVTSQPAKKRRKVGRQQAKQGGRGGGGHPLPRTNSRMSQKRGNQNSRNIMYRRVDYTETDQREKLRQWAQRRALEDEDEYDDDDDDGYSRDGSDESSRSNADFDDDDDDDYEAMANTSMSSHDTTGSSVFYDALRHTNEADNIQYVEKQKRRKQNQQQRPRGGKQYKNQRERNQRGRRKRGVAMGDDVSLTRPSQPEKVYRSSFQAFKDQFLANLELMVMERKRSCCSCVIEAILPPIFILVTIVISIALKTNVYDELQPMNYTALDPLPLKPSIHKTLMCANDNTSPLDTRPLITGLPPCSTFASGFACPEDDSELPVKGLCCDGRYAPKDLVMGYISSFNGSLAYVPDYDTIVAFQWLARASLEVSSDAGLKQLASAGLMSNSVLNSIVRSGDIIFAPDNGNTRALAQYFQDTTEYYSLTNHGVFPTVEAAEDYVRGGPDPEVWALIEVNSMTPTNLNVTIQVHSDAIPLLSENIDPVFSGGCKRGRADLYHVSGFLTLQNMVYKYYVDNVIANPEVSALTDYYEPYSVSMGAIAYKENQMIYGASFLVALVITLGYLYSVSSLTKRLVVEKELRLEEATLIMGMTKTPRLLSIVVYYFLQHFVVSLVGAALLKLSYLNQSNYYILFLVVFSYAVNTIAMGFLFSSFFSKTRMATLITPLAYFMMSVPIFAMTDAPGSVVKGLSWITPTGFAGLFNLILTHEVSSGMRPEHMWYIFDDPQVGFLIIMLWVDFAIYMLLGLYFEAVLPKDCGTPKHPLFFIIDPFKACCCSNKKGIDDSDELLPDGRDENGAYEDEGPDQVNAVRITGLRKVFKRGGHTFVAVNNLYLNLADGGISVLLGHNGAGKTTVMNMMTGMTLPDGGDCYVYGHSVRYEMEQVRQELGYCPQHNILWRDLSCREHLEFYGKVKGLRGPALEDAVRKVLREVDMLDKIEYSAADLSGGMKRKLSVAIAFVGGSRLVFLDEPTAGMDAAARRHTWELLLRMSVSRSVLLTTHFMDEADLLGDRIAIMSHGCLKCCGSSLFLKSRLGVGYNIAISLNSAKSGGDVQALVFNNVPNSEVLEDKGTEVTYRLPSGEANNFPYLLSAIEQESDDLGIRGYALSATTLEEVFLKVAEDDLHPTNNDEEMSDSNYSADSLTSAVGNPMSHRDRVRAAVWEAPLVVDNSALFWMQFWCMLKKRLYNAKRDYRMMCFQIVCPILCVLLAMLLNLVKFSGATVYSVPDGYPLASEVVLTGCDKAFGPTAKAYTDDVLQTPMNDFNTVDLNNYLTDSWWTHQRPGRFAGYSCNDGGLQMVMRIMGMAPRANFMPLVGLYNVSSEHEIVSVMRNMYSSMIMNAMNVANPIHTVIKSLPKTASESVLGNGITSLLVGCIIMIPFTFLPSNCVTWVVKERECKSRHLQNLSGLRFSVYWITNFIFDFVSYLVTMVLVLIVFAVFNRQEFIGADTFGATLLLLLVFGVCGICTAYLFQFVFTGSATAQSTTMVVGFVTGFLCAMLVNILGMVERTRSVSKVIKWPFRLIPTYSVGEGIINLSTLDQNKVSDSSLTAMSMSVIGWPCIFMGIEIPVFTLITLLLDHPGLRQRRQRSSYDADGPIEVVSGEDTDVEEEREEVTMESEELIRRSEARLEGNDSFGSRGSSDSGSHSAASSDDEGSSRSGSGSGSGSGSRTGSGGSSSGDGYEPDAVTVLHLHKKYPNGKVAVRDVTFTVVPGEVFGFLGTNGAGKTTSISILCQEFLPTSGRAFICGYDIVQESQEALRCVGYCPQFDATLDLLTVEEHLRVFAGVRGVSKEMQKDVIEGLIDICELQNYRNVLSCELSGGNRRKLSVALALIGGPQVVFLDEPSAGMDPVARRGLWTSIQAIGEMCSIVLTTHHLEEVEALADCVAIMVKGGLRCIGNKVHLKNKYGSGFEMSLRIQSPQVKEMVEKFIESSFPGAVQNEYRSRRFVYALPKHTFLSDVFTLLQENKEHLGITDYSVSQTSIEQVFMRISEEAAAEEAAAQEMKKQSKRRLSK